MGGIRGTHMGAGDKDLGGKGTDCGTAFTRRTRDTGVVWEEFGGVHLWSLTGPALYLAVSLYLNVVSQACLDSL